MSPEKGRIVRRPDSREQIAQFRLMAPPSVDQFLFPAQTVNLRFLFEKIVPRPLVERRLFLLRISPEFGEKSLRGTFLGKSQDWETTKIEEDKVDGREVKESLKRVGGIVIFVDGEPPEELATVLDAVSKQLKPEVKVWILERTREQKLGLEEKDARLSLLENYGLVKRKVVAVGNEPFCLWYGRMAKEREKMVVDLTQKPWFRFVLARAKFVYQEQKWKEIDFGQILGRCRASTFPPRDLRDLKYGFGVELLAYCDCRWKVSFAGDWTRIENCSEEGCSGLP